MTADLRDRLVQRVRRTPDAIAVEDGTRSLSFSVLHRRVDALAQVLLARGAGPERRVAVLSPRTVDLMVALLAVVRAGAAFVPLDPAHPAARHRAILEDSGATLILAAPGTPAGPAGPAVLCTDERPVDGARRIPLPAVHPEHAAYVMYTSGSTGTPKGVVIPYRALLRYLDWAVQAYGGAGPTPLPTSPAFDLTLTALFVPLLGAGGVHLVPDDAPGALTRVLRTRRWALAKLTPSHLTALRAQWTVDGTGSPEIGVLVVGGEALHARHLEGWQAAGVFNEYGPTEATVGCCVHQVRPGDPADVPIGAPLPYARIDLDPGGELLVGGGAVARGYLNRPGVTASRFVPDPAGRGARRYRTGDLASRDGGGPLRYHGRADRQLKLRGFRVEPGDIETALRAAPGVADAAVIPGPGRTHLVGYVVAEPGARLDPERLRAHLAERLPGYLVPARVVELPALPLTGNGKVDHDRLPAAHATARLAAAVDRLDALTESDAMRLLGAAGTPRADRS